MRRLRLRYEDLAAIEMDFSPNQVYGPAIKGWWWYPAARGWSPEPDCACGRPPPVVITPRYASVLIGTAMRDGLIVPTAMDLWRTAVAARAQVCMEEERLHPRPTI